MKVITCVTNLTQVGYKHALQASCKYYNLELITLESQNWKSFRDRNKVYQKYLSTLDADEIVFFTDGYDVVFVSGENEILEKYKRISPEGTILMSADRFCAPDPTKSHFFKTTSHGYNFLCAGGFMGNAGNIITTIDALFKTEQDDNSTENKHYFWCDQYMWTKALIDKKINIVLDHNCEIFQTFTSQKSIENLYNFVNNEQPLSEDEDLYLRSSITKTIEAILDEVEITDNQRVFNKSTKTYPVQIHYNTKINKLVMFMEPFISLINNVN